MNKIHVIPWSDVVMMKQTAKVRNFFANCLFVVRKLVAVVTLLIYSVHCFDPNSGLGCWSSSPAFANEQAHQRVCMK